MQTGSYEWGQKHQGQLTHGQRLGQILQALTLELQRASRHWLRQMGLSSQRLPQAAWRGLQIPDSPLAQKAARYCIELSPEYLVGHCLRSFAWASLLAQRDDLRYDAEILYLACMLHDLGLTDSALPDEHQACFAMTGAQAAARILPSPVAEKVAEAIALHLNVQVTLRSGTEAHLLRQGSGLDIIGLRYHDISEEARQQVLHLYPRADFAPQVRARMEDPRIRRPGTRIHLLCQGGFLQRIQHNPWERSPSRRIVAQPESGLQSVHGSSTELS